MNAVIAGAQEHQRCCQVKERNRYQEVPCLDVTRVVLKQDTPAGCDFIHGKEPDTYVVEVLPDGCSNSLIATLYHAKWPFGKVPGSGLINLLRSMKTAGKDGPITVASSQGIGRAPVFTAVDITMTRLFKGQKTRLLEVATEIRKQRALSFEDYLHYMLTVEASLKYLRAKVKKHGDAVKKYLESIVALKTDPV